MLPFVAPLPEGTPCYGVLGRFRDVTELQRACAAVRDAGYTRWDAHSPFPIHGLSRAAGLRASPLPWIVLFTGLGGATLGMLLQWWVATRAYPLVISGKPFFSWPAFVPITFELGVLGAALGAVLGMLGLNRLPMHHHPLFGNAAFEAATDDAFFVSIEAWDPKFDAVESAAFLRHLGAVAVDRIEHGGPANGAPR